MKRPPISLEALDAQEERFAAAFGAGDISMALPLYAPDVVYVSPTTRLFGWPHAWSGWNTPSSSSR